MASRRTLKAAEAIREVVAMALLTDLADPRVRQVTITGVEVAADMRAAKVYFSVLGQDPVQEKLAKAGLKSAAGFLQQKCARRIDTRYTPRLTFAVDEGVKNLVEVSRLLAEEKLQREEASGAFSTATEEDRDEVIDSGATDSGAEPNGAS